MAGLCARLPSQTEASAEPSPESRPEDHHLLTKAWSSMEHGARGNIEKLECTGVLGIQFLLFVFLGSKEELVFGSG